MLVFKNEKIRVESGAETFLSVQCGIQKIVLQAPSFALDGEQVSSFQYAGCTQTKKGVLVQYQSRNEVQLALELQAYPQSSILRFRYRLSSDTPVTMTKSDGMDQISYFTGAVGGEQTARWNELQFAQYLPHLHSFVPHVERVKPIQLMNGCTLAGPLLAAETEQGSVLLAYEHGAEYPNHYLHFELMNGEVSLHSTKGNYYHGQLISAEQSWQSCWMQVGVLDSHLEELYREYRHFMLELLPVSAESRKPYVFYNTWNYQERDFNLNGRPYLSRMTLDKILLEIDAAHEIGVELFVIDTGWYGKTGDWLVNLEKFPDHLEQVRERLEGYGMKLGLWFNPTVAARTSQIVEQHPEYRMSMDGKSEAHPVWETEESFGMCLCSDYAGWFAEKLITLYHTLGVRYFKWDGIGQFGCNSPLHGHGTDQNSAQERAECYSYQMGLAMIEVVERLLASCPDAIVDFDVTEAGRFVGLSFLSVGKYFLVNNGPYAKDFDLPEQFDYQQPETMTLNPWTNLFFYPGSARPRFCRTGIRYDFLVPSQLFLTHYLPEGNLQARENSFASFALGGNGIWGDLALLSVEERDYWKAQLRYYKQVREAASRVAAVTCGIAGSSPEIYEKICPDTGCGLAVFFTCQAGDYIYDTDVLKELPREIVGADRYEILPNQSVRLFVSLKQDDARTIFFIG